ncbi:SIMPL domain-containing protein [Flaviaesturariibacter amylovorans]|uniref:SIMPL domain-containing protein n=1 Tax=Flaviaesturariibacter amylovorans TaxID=1084520 RepID=A0ABP8GMR5_9BACT
MKKSFLSFLLAVACLGAPAQSPAASYPFPRTISVTGTAEQELVPDEIHVQVELKEYGRPGAPKVTLDGIRRQFLNTVRSLGIADSLVNVVSYDGYNDAEWWERKRNRKDQLQASVTYGVKLRSTAQVNELVDRLDPHATQNFQVARVSHSRITEIRRQLKIAAVKAAKEKAAYMAEASGDRIGETVSINENSDNADGPVWWRSGGMMTNTVLQGPRSEDAQEGAPGFQKIRLKFEVAAVFALK